MTADGAAVATPGTAPDEPGIVKPAPLVSCWLVLLATATAATSAENLTGCALFRWGEDAPQAREAAKVARRFVAWFVSVEGGHPPHFVALRVVRFPGKLVFELIDERSPPVAFAAWPDWAGQLEHGSEWRVYGRGRITWLAIPTGVNGPWGACVAPK